MQRTFVNALRPEIGFALLARSMQGATMLAAALCAAWRLRVEEQGIFFVLLSLGALLQLCDFGLSDATLQTASHLRVADDDVPSFGFPTQANQMTATVLAAAVISIAALGALIVSARPDAAHAQFNWAGPWIAFIAAVFIAQRVNLEVVLLEGSRSAVVAWRLRFVQEILGGCVFIGTPRRPLCRRDPAR